MGFTGNKIIPKTKTSSQVGFQAEGIGYRVQRAMASVVTGMTFENSLRISSTDGYNSPRSMSQTSLRDIILQVKENADIVQIIGQYVPLKKAGSRYLGLCPFHHDRKPSMNVTPQMGIYKCFACGAGGDVLKFVQEYEKLDFLDALKAVAARAGVTIPEHLVFSKDDGDKGKASQALAANQLACQVYREELDATPEVMAYVAGRGINEETRKHFQLGLAPQTPEKLLKRAAAKGIPNQAMIDAGILGEAAGGRLYDRFSGRLIFPIWNMSGHVIGFGGRVLPNKDPNIPLHPAKYVNSPESPFYHKSKVLYGLNFSRNDMDKSGECVIVEGYMDLLALWQAGIHNAVAVSGTALTKEHVHILARFTRKAFMFLDGDEPGRKAVRRSLEPLIGMGLEVKIPVLPKEEDPDSFTRKFGGEKVREIFAQSDDIVGFLVRSAEKPLDAMSPEEKDGLWQDGLALLQAMPSPVVREGYAEELRKKLGLKSLGRTVTRAFPGPRAQSQQGLQGGSTSASGDVGSEDADTVAVFSGNLPGGRPRDVAFGEWQLLQLLLSSPEACAWALDGLQLEWIQTDAVRGLVDHLLAFFEETRGLDMRAFLERLAPADQDLVGGMRLIDGMEIDQQRKHFSGIMTALELRHLQRRKSQETDLRRHAEILKRIRDIQSKTKGGNP